MLVWPFKVLWQAAALLLDFFGSLFAVLIGVVLMIVGVVLTLTIIGAIVGIPVGLLGFMLVIKGLF